MWYQKPTQNPKPDSHVLKSGPPPSLTQQQHEIAVISSDVLIIIHNNLEQIFSLSFLVRNKSISLLQYSEQEVILTVYKLKAYLNNLQCCSAW